MSWHFSQALVEEYSAENFLVGEQSAPWRSIPSAPDDSCSGKMKDTFHRSPYGTMFVPLTDAHGAELLTWYRVAFPARISAPLERASGLKESALACGVSSRESSGKYDPVTRSWKIPQCLCPEDWGMFSATLPDSGIMLHGQFWAQETAVPVMKESASGFSQPTPVCYDATGSSETRGMPGLVDWSHQRYSQGAKKSWLVPELLEQVMGWPIGWTGLAPLETDRFQQWSQRHAQFWLTASYSSARRVRPSVVHRPNEAKVKEECDAGQPRLF
jgi:hypothetical protein